MVYTPLLMSSGQWSDPVGAQQFRAEDQRRRAPLRRG